MPIRLVQGKELKENFIFSYFGIYREEGSRWFQGLRSVSHFGKQRILRLVISPNCGGENLKVLYAALWSKHDCIVLSRRYLLGCKTLLVCVLC